MFPFRVSIRIILFSLSISGAAFHSCAQERTFQDLFREAYICRDCADSIQIALYSAAIQAGISDSLDINNFHNALVNRAQLAGRNGDPDMAIRDYNLALGVEPDFYNVRQQLGTLYLENGQYQKAIEQFDIFIRRIQTEREEMLKAFNGDTEELQVMRQEVLREMNEQMAPAYNNRALAKAYSGDHAAACKDFRKAYACGMNALTDFLDKECGE